jgi:hypothetical protein
LTIANNIFCILNDIEKIFYKFLWNGKKDKIKRSIIINEYEEGGLKMPNIQSFYKALKMQNGLTFSAIFSRPSLLQYNILLPPHFCI